MYEAVVNVLFLADPEEFVSGFEPPPSDHDGWSYFWPFEVRPEVGARVFATRRPSDEVLPAKVVSVHPATEESKAEIPVRGIAQSGRNFWDGARPQTYTPHSRFD